MFNFFIFFIASVPCVVCSTAVCLFVFYQGVEKSLGSGRKDRVGQVTGNKDFLGGGGGGGLMSSRSQNHYHVLKDESESP